MRERESEPDYLEVEGVRIDASEALVHVCLWSARGEGTETVEIVFFDPDHSVRCRVELTTWLAAACGAKALKKVRDLCDRLIAAREAET